ncbi:MAG: BACON domain-containing carbohydrate-binding protein [Candidatus Contendobacter sp.]|nr:BACON domain-containing carbohydrate-binding protein [Candidatus Contendobacter sp.]MDG4559543.1 BACON domain-containing carbohydrate-binding protein [Candidatus Contendobacter sp.]
MSHSLSPASLVLSPFWLVLSLFSTPVGAVNPPGSYGGAAIAAGFLHTLALNSNHALLAWGNNVESQLGDGTTTARTTPAQIFGLSSVVAIAGGGWYTVVLKSDGTVWTWGLNSNGQIGNGTTTARTIPDQVPGLSGVVAIAIGDSHTVVLKTGGTVWAWGNNDDGQLGDGTTTDRSIPVQVPGLSSVVAITANGWHTVALKSDGTVWAWGSNDGGQLGDGTTTNRSIPVQVPGLNGVAAIAAGGHHTVALKGDGTVWTWGKNGGGQLGNGTIIDRSAPVQVPSLSGVTAIAAGGWHTLALKSDGAVWAWGTNRYGNLGDRTTIDRSTPVQVPGLNGVAAIAAGGWHTLALKSDGAVWAWGLNDHGQLGDGTTTDRHTPVQVLGPGGSGYLNLLPATPPSTSSSRATNLSISQSSPGRYRLLGTLVDANGQSACGLALASGRCVFTCGPGSLRCEGGVDSLPLGQFDLTDLPTETDGTLTLQTFVFGSLPGRQVVRSDGTAQLVNSDAASSNSRALNPSVSAVSPGGRYRLLGTLVDANGQPACGLALASGRCVFTCGPGSLRCEGGASNLPLGQFELTDLPTEADGTLTLQTFVFGSLPGRQSQVAIDGGSGCSHTIDPTSQAFDYLGGAGTVTVSTQSSCTWTAQSHDDWITVNAGASGTGPGAVTYSVAANSSSAKRTGTLTIAAKTHTVTQAAKGIDPGD